MKKHYFLLPACVLAFGLTAPDANAFEKAYGGSNNDSGRDFEMTADGGFLIAGETFSSGAGWADVYLVKTNADGDRQWSKTIGGVGDDEAWSMAKTQDGNFVIAGYTRSWGAGAEDFFLVKVDQNGNEKWKNYYGTAGMDIAREVQATPDGGYILVGYTQSNGYDLMIVKTDASGTEQWRKVYGGAQYESGYSIKPVPGGYVVFGTTYTYGMGAGDGWILKIDESGNMMPGFPKTLGGNQEEEGQYVEVLPDGNFVFVLDAMSNSMGDFDVMVTKTTASGTVLWTKMLGGVDKDVAKMIKPTSDGGMIVSAITRSGIINPNFWLIKLNAAGTKIWDKNYGGVNHEHCYATKELPNGNFVSVGHTQSMGSGMDDVYFISTTSTGELLITTPELSSTSFIKVFPNPSNGKVFVSADGNMNNCEITVMNISGAILLQRRIKDINEQQIDLSGLAKGIYFLRVGSERGEQTTKLLID